MTMRITTYEKEVSIKYGQTKCSKVQIETNELNEGEYDLF